MKKRIGVFIVSLVITGLTLGLFGMTLVSQAAPAGKTQNLYRQAPKPIPAADIEVVKKVFSGDVEKGKGKPSAPPKTGGAATGVLGDYPVTGTKYAVVIGICDYPGTQNDICQSDGDSLHMYKALTELYGYKPENIRLFKDSGGTTGSTLGSVDYGVPTRDNIYKAIVDIKSNATLGDEVVFFFSGHGARGEANDGDAEITDEAIVVWKTEDKTDNNNITYIWDGELKNWFSGFGTTRIVFVFDSCLAGGMNDVADTGRIVNMATGETQSAYVYSTAGEDVDGDGIKDGEGVFSRLFVNEGMLMAKADKYDHDKDGSLLEPTDVVVEEAFDYAKANIPPYLKVRQKPVISDNFTDDLLL
jgi:hypothetical protein